MMRSSTAALNSGSAMPHATGSTLPTSSSSCARNWTTGTFGSCPSMLGTLSWTRRTWGTALGGADSAGRMERMESMERTERKENLGLATVHPLHTFHTLHTAHPFRTLAALQDANGLPARLGRSC